MSQKSEDNKNHTRRTFEVREETIFDYLMHAATREDIANLRLEVKDDIANLRSEVKEDIAKLDAKIDRVSGQLDSKIDRVEERLTKKIDGHFKWLTGFLIIAVMAPFVANLIT